LGGRKGDESNGIDCVTTMGTRRHAREQTRTEKVVDGNQQIGE